MIPEIWAARRRNRERGDRWRTIVGGLAVAMVAAVFGYGIGGLVASHESDRRIISLERQLIAAQDQRDRALYTAQQCGATLGRAVNAGEATLERALDEKQEAITLLDACRSTTGYRPPVVAVSDSR